MSAQDTPLGRELKDLIAAEGPIPVARYMALCLGHPRHGYYMTREPFGAAGDFTTAPEISQVFGELIGAWAAASWQAMGRPSSVRLVELGPGRGTLMADMARAAQGLPGYADALDIHLVETSPRLRERQRRTLAAAGWAASWHEDLATVPAGPTLLVANEFLDALPVRQFVMTERGWRERVVGLNADGALAFGLAPDPVPASLIHERLRAAQPGAVAELCPAFETHSLPAMRQDRSPPCSSTTGTSPRPMARRCRRSRPTPSPTRSPSPASPTSPPMSIFPPSPAARRPPAWPLPQP
jgi:SAM-dependent MidA family methyltransferase